MVKKIKKNKGIAKAEAKTKKAKATATAKQKVIINIGKGGGKGAGKSNRNSAPARQQQQQQQQYQGPTHYDFGQLKSDILENVGNKFNQFVEKKASDILNIPSTTSETTTTTYDVAGLVGAGTGLLKSAYDIYKDYSESERLQRKYKVPNVPLPVAKPVNPPNLEGIISRPLPVPRKPLLSKREEKEREVKENPTNYDVPQIQPRPERRALPTERKKTPSEISTEQMLADRDRRNKMTQESKEANKPLIPFMNLVPAPPQIQPRPEKQALPTRKEPQFSVGEEPKEIISGSVKEHKIAPNYTNTYDVPYIALRPEKQALPTRKEPPQPPKFSVGEEPKEIIRGQPVPSFLRNPQTETVLKAWDKSLYKQKEDVKVNNILQQPAPVIQPKQEEKIQEIKQAPPNKKQEEKIQEIKQAQFPLKQRKPVGRTSVLPEEKKQEEKHDIPERGLLSGFPVKELRQMYPDLTLKGSKSSIMTQIINTHKQEAGVPVKPIVTRVKDNKKEEEARINKLKADALKELNEQKKANIKKLDAKKKAEEAKKKADAGKALYKKKEDERKKK